MCVQGFVWNTYVYVCGVRVVRVMRVMPCMCVHAPAPGRKHVERK